MNKAVLICLKPCC